MSLAGGDPLLKLTGACGPAAGELELRPTVAAQIASAANMAP